MARPLTTEQRALLRSPTLEANLLVSMWLDEGPVHFCDNTDDVTDGTTVWNGAAVLLAATEIRASSPLVAEGVNITLDGTRLYNAGVEDPGYIIGALFEVAFHQRRVDMLYGFRAQGESQIQLVIPAYAGKINHIRVIDEATDLQSDEPQASKMEMQLDALAARYGRRSYRTRSHDDHQQLAPGDMFFSFVHSAVQNEGKLFWGKKAPTAAATPTTPGSGVQGSQTALSRWINRT